MKRPEINQQQYDVAVAAVPAPAGYTWCLDPAASSDRLRLFSDSAAREGEVCRAYPDGSWLVHYPIEEGYGHAADGQVADLHAAMERGLKLAEALGRGFRK